MNLQVVWTLSMSVIALAGCSESDSGAVGAADVLNETEADGAGDAIVDSEPEVTLDTPPETDAADAADPSTDDAATPPVLCQARIGCNPADFDDIDELDSDADCPAAIPEAGGECAFGVDACYYCEDPEYDAPHGDDPVPWVMWTCSAQGTWVDRSPGVACTGS